ncbi:MAG: sulfatase-like hydrolase/transferase, partial [Alphaproteobacteria bacterium]|nr:sulfatase-like hydrolase/transferase [Alphaproteobacteria bacterium]
SVIAANRHEDERRDPHPVHAAFMEHEDSRSFARDEVRRAVIPAYMGLVKEIDDHMGRLFAFLEEQGRMEDTMIVFTSDHGDYLGDHWLGEKELFHEESVRIPLIVYDPEGTPGAVVEDLVESIDLVPTFVEAAGGEVQPHRMEGRSLLPLLRGGEAPARDAVFAETDYAHRAARLTLGRGVDESRGYMVRTERWKYLFWEGYRPQLFDLAEDPLERIDLGGDPAHAAARAELHERLFAWLRARRTRTTLSDAEVEQRTDSSRKRGFIIGVW